jgi:hypothetical protein
MNHRIRIFISGKQSEFEVERIAVAREILSIPILEPVLAEDWSAQGGSAQEATLRDARTCPIFIGLFGCNYSEPTKLEYLAASENPYRELLIYLKECSAPDPPLLELIKTLEHRVTFKRFRSVADLLPAFSEHLLGALNRMVGNYQLLGNPKPVVQGSGGVLERRWAHQLRYVATLGLPGDLSPENNELLTKGLSDVLNERGFSNQAELASERDRPHPAASSLAFDSLAQPGNEKLKYEAQQLFPQISCDPTHVIQNKKFTAIVRVLREKPDAEFTKGDFWLPPAPPDQVHTVNVHLLMRDQSKQGVMTCSAAVGTLKEAVFELHAPEMEADASGKSNESMVELIRVNFYLNGRWCGEAQQNIEILRDEKVKPSEAKLIPEEPVWRQHLHVEPGAEPPDFLIRIQPSLGDTFRWTLISPHLNFKLRDQDCIQTLAKPERYVTDNFEWLAGKKSDGINRDNVEGSCERLYDATPQAFKDAYWQLFHAAATEIDTAPAPTEVPIKFETIQFVSDEPCIPWEIMRIVDRNIEPDVAPVILSEKYKVGRWLAKSSCVLRSQINVREFRVATSTYTGVKNVLPLPWTQGERDYLSAEPWNAQNLDLLLEDIRKFLVEGTAQAIHFACHGEMDQAQPQRSKILLEDDLINFRTTAVARDAVRMGIGKHHPLVFLNACQLGAEGKVLSLGSGWPQAFLDVGASAFIGPLWSVQDESARDAATHFYEELRLGKSMGEALQTMRRKWLDGGSVTFLAYTLYGDPTAKVVRIPETVPT